jgi:hypothetical protein
VRGSRSGGRPAPPPPREPERTEHDPERRTRSFAAAGDARHDAAAVGLRDGRRGLALAGGAALEPRGAVALALAERDAGAAKTPAHGCVRPMLNAALRAPYPSDMSDEQWALIADSIPTPRPHPNFPKAIYPRREIVNGILYFMRTGCQWRHLPHDFPKWQLVASYD